MAKHPKPRPATHRRGYIPWHVRMRQLGIDVETCPRCGGKMKAPPPTIKRKVTPKLLSGHARNSTPATPAPRVSVVLASSVARAASAARPHVTPRQFKRDKNQQ
jgi:hypothetical protein